MSEVDPIQAQSEQSMKERSEELFDKFNDEVWNFQFSNSRNTYYVHTSALVPDATQELRDIIVKQELSLNRDEADVIGHYLHVAKNKLAEQMVNDEQLSRLAYLEGVFAKNSMLLAPAETEVRLGTMSTGTTEADATILVPKQYETFLVLRAACGTLERAIVIETKEPEPYEMKLKVPGLFALEAIVELLEEPPATDDLYRAGYS